MNVSRADNSGFARWWWTIDRMALAATFSLVAIGLVLAFAASPAATGHVDAVGNFSYALKQVGFAATAIVIMVGTSLLDFKETRLLAAWVFAAALIGAFLALMSGVDVNGAHRWIDFGGLKLQPSEFLKPAFAVLAAAFLADKLKHGFPGNAVTLGLLVPALGILLLQPDVGQTMLLATLCVSMLFLAGLPYYWLAAMAGAGSGLAFIAYYLFPHVRVRIEEFMHSGGYQTGLALKAFEAGGVAGVGPGAGTIKYRLPDAHTDFIFAVAGEEFGAVLCGVIALLFCVLSVRLLSRAAKQSDPFAQLAGAALGVVVAMQALINMAVATNLMPAKGMTLPFISYGGSSLFAVALTMGFALSVTRQRPKIAERDVELFKFLKEAHA
jgi:cell division protein FtsW